MKTLDNHEVRSDGGRHEIKLGVTFTDPDTPEYEHSISWHFEPTFATDTQTPFLEVSGFIHKKYWTEISDEIDHTLYTTDDGSEIVESGGWFDKPYEAKTLPESVRTHFNSLFGTTLTENTFERAAELTTVDRTPIDIPEIPTDHKVHTFEINLKLDGSYTEELDEDDPRVVDGSYTRHIKNADGEITSTYYTMSHNASWWIQPVADSNGVEFEIQKCFHKTWDEGMVGSFDCEYENEKIVESYQEGDEIPPLSSLPDAILTALSEWFGEETIQEALSDCNRSLPKYVYECMACSTDTIVTARNSCPRCSEESLCRYESYEDYMEIKADETEEEQQLKEMLVNAEPTVSEAEELN